MWSYPVDSRTWNSLSGSYGWDGQFLSEPVWFSVTQRMDSEEPLHYRQNTEGNSHSSLKTSHHKITAKCVSMSMLTRSISYSSMLISSISYSSKYLHQNHTFHMVNIYNALSFWRRLANTFFQTSFEYNFQVTENNDSVLYGLERQDKGGGSGQIAELSGGGRKLRWES